MKGEACALASALVWSVGVILFKRSEEVSPQGINLFKNLFGLLLFIPTLLLLGLSVDWDRASADWWALAISGALGIGIADTMIFMALRRLGASLLAIADCSYAPTMVLLAIFWLNEPYSVYLFLGGALVVGGVYLAVAEKTPGALPPRNDLIIGGLLGMTGIVAMGIGVMLVKPIVERADASIIEVTLVRLSFGVLTQVAWIALVPSQRSALKVFSARSVWPTLIPASILGVYVAMMLWLGSFKWANASVASVLHQISSVFTVILAWLILKEPMTRRRALGTALAVGGAILVVLTAPD
ncbi:MAG: DMT family transporter [Acidobacteriota bacterium]